MIISVNFNENKNIIKSNQTKAKRKIIIIVEKLCSTRKSIKNLRIEIGSSSHTSRKHFNKLNLGIY